MEKHTRLLAVLLVVGCSGEIPSDNVGSAGGSGGGGRGRTPNVPSTGGTGGGPSPTSPVPAGRFDPGPTAFRRLTHLQYANTVAAVLGVSVNLQQLLGSDRSLQDYANGGIQAAPSDGLVQTYAAAAAALADAATAPAARAGLWDAGTCGDTNACLTSFVRAYGRRLFRRPLEAAESSAILTGAAAEAQAAGSFWPGARHALEVMLQAVPFLYVIDTGETNTAHPDLLRRGPHAVATRLSVLLWNRGPDDQLLDLADKGGLRTSADVATQVARMVDDPRAQETFRSFFREWLGYDLAPVVSKDAVHVDYTPELARALVAETDRLVEHFLAGNAPVMDIFNTDYSFASDDVAKFYKAEIDPRDSKRFKLPAGRRGILGHASFIAVNSGSGMHSPTLRGLSILKRFLCSDVASPPPTAPAELPESEDNTPRTIRERTETFMLANPSCNYCHNHMDPVGFLFESFDAIGKHRTAEAVAGAPGGTRPISAKGSILAFQLENVDGLAGLGAALSSHADARACLMKNVVRWSLGREHEAVDATLLARLSESYSKGSGSFRGLVAEVAKSDALLYMRKPQ